MSPMRMIACAPVVVASIGCSASSTDGVAISVVIEAPSTALPAGDDRVIVTDLGYRVTLTRAYLSTGSVEILACGVRTSWRDIFIRDAHAHTTGSPTTLGIPAVESLLAPSGHLLAVGALRPPSGSYCRIRQTITAADEDAVGLSADVPMVGKSLLVEGMYERGGEASTFFIVSSAISVDVETSVARTELSARGVRVAQLVLTKTGDRWFDGIDFALSTETDLEPRLLQNIRRSLGARFQ